MKKLAILWTFYIAYIIESCNCSDKENKSEIKSNSAYYKGLESVSQETNCVNLQTCHASIAHFVEDGGSLNNDQTLDLAEECPSGVNMTQHCEREVTHRIYAPRKGAAIVLIKDSGMEVWRSNGDEKCTFVQCYKGETTLLALEIRACGSFRVKHLELRESSWIGVRLREFTMKLNKMMGISRSFNED
ncbi:hypothetical protein BEWA_047020 [Theileria equi strain WA]|uniref:Signal peptide containing protein n=1 Tax=Theileria equi strain WA TaxID=1537102 RepID=L1LAR0_THEEQ|nr:hypothetical protein BEWA_047020 [Theileria equi strain WA]EKX72238.1 hypothetical protein BEWA_047020 [Theileria equi strain WA]|eukprot:XP_004831690.1 hypothetical protein BEWA_047020 [Theileria equi strain WA]